MIDTVTLLKLFGTIVVASPAFLVAVLGSASLIGRPLSERASFRMVSLSTVLGLLAAIGILIVMIVGKSLHVELVVGNWVHFEGIAHESHYHFAIKFQFDRLSVPFVILTYVLCSAIGTFANRYMHRESGYNRFFTLYSIFVAGMVIAATSGTIETLFLGWELVGLSSALLVGYFHERPAPVRNALRIWVIYRFSDAALLLAALVLHHMTGEGDFDRVTGYRDVLGSALPPTSWPDGSCTLMPFEALAVGGLLLAAAMGKSALVPFSGMLPRANEGPTPSSAVFYGALSVHLGAYLLLRSGPLLDASPVLSTATVVLGLATSFLAMLSGRVQTDVKSALSYASMTQVGLIVAEIGLGWRYLPLIHIIGHACLRTLQFIRAPNAIRDHKWIENALGQRVARSNSTKFTWLYRFALERGYFDALLDRYIALPFITLFRWFSQLEQRVSAKLAGTEHNPPSQNPTGSPPLSSEERR
ncbi:MAG: proton-conducting transporter membrane subunit [Gemmataceae bacterium]